VLAKVTAGAYGMCLAYMARGDLIPLIGDRIDRILPIRYSDQSGRSHGHCFYKPEISPFPVPIYMYVWSSFLYMKHSSCSAILSFSLSDMVSQVWVSIHLTLLLPWALHPGCATTLPLRAITRLRPSARRPEATPSPCAPSPGRALLWPWLLQICHRHLPSMTPLR
jgi:hypothetical protein